MPDLARRRAGSRACSTIRACSTAFRRLLDELAAQSTGSSTFVARALLLDEPPSIDAREITDKGSLNQKAVLAESSGSWVDELYASPRRSSRSCIERP